MREIANFLYISLEKVCLRKLEGKGNFFEEMEKKTLEKIA
jgi:hypothetical protein